MSREQKSVEESFVAMLAPIWILSTVLEDYVFLELKLSAESLVALSAGLRQWIFVKGSKVTIHAVFVSKHLITVVVLAGNRCDLRLSQMTSLKMTF